MAKIPERRIYLPNNISILLYGGSDAGKTVLASISDDLDPKELKFVNNALFIDVEDGMVSHLTRGAGIIVERFPSDPNEVVDSKEDLGLAIDYLKDNKDRFEYVSLDSLDRYQEYLVDNMLSPTKPRPQIQDWGDLLISLQRLGRMAPTWGVNVVFTCHDTQDVDENDNRVTKRMPLIQGSFRGKVQSYFDVVAYYERIVQPDQTIVRRLHTQGSKQFVARSRLGSCLPEYIDNPTIPGMLAEYRKRRRVVIEEMKKHPGIVITGENS